MEETKALRLMGRVLTLSRLRVQSTNSQEIVEVKPENSVAFEKIVNTYNMDCCKIGQVTGNKIYINDIYKDLDKTSEIYFNRFRQVIEQDL